MEFSHHLFSVTHVGTPVIIADQKTDHSALVDPGLILLTETAELARAVIGKAKAKKTRSGWDPQVQRNTASFLVSGKDRMACVMTDGEITYTTPIRIRDEVRPLGHHLYSLLGKNQDGRSFRSMAFGFRGQPEKGMSVDR